MAVFEKPFVPDDFPLSWHKHRGYWMKSIKGKKYMFGHGADPHLALKDWKLNADRIRNGLGRLALGDSGEVTVADLIEPWITGLNIRLRTRKKGEKGYLTGNSYAESERMAKLVDELIGDVPVRELSELHFSKVAARLSQYAVSTKRRRKTIIRGIFTCKTSRQIYNGIPDFFLEDIDFGDQMDLETGTELKFNRVRQKDTVSPEGLRRMLDHEALPARLRACVLLGINCFMNAQDCADVTRESVNGEWLENMRLKKKTARKMWLWPETREALEAAKSDHDVPLAGGEGHLLLTSSEGNVLVTCDHTGRAHCDACGRRRRIPMRGLTVWECKCGEEYRLDELVLTDVKESRKDLIGQQWRHWAGECEVEGTFSWLRGTAASVASEEGRFTDRCIKLAMGQSSQDVLEFYQNGNPEPQLREMGECLRDWLFAT